MKTHNLDGCKCPKGSDIRFCLGEKIEIVDKDERQAVIKEVEGWLVDENVEFYKLDEKARFVRRVRNEYRAELRAKLVEMKEGK